MSTLQIAPPAYASPLIALAKGWCFRGHNFAEGEGTILMHPVSLPNVACGACAEEYIKNGSAVAVSADEYQTFEVLER